MDGIKPTWPQRHISPILTRINAIAYLNRRSIAWGVRSVAANLNENEMTPLKMILNKHRIIQPEYINTPLKSLEHFHMTRNITTTKLLLAANEFYHLTGRDDLLKTMPSIVEGRISGKISLSLSRPIDYAELFSAHKPRILHSVLSRAFDEEAWESKVIDQAFDLARERSRTPQEELLYRMQKMADINGDIQTVIASLFIGMDAEQFDRAFENAKTPELYNLKESIRSIVFTFQQLNNGIRFDRNKMATDNKYLSKKMSEIIRGARSPQVLLLFLFGKLTDARRANGANEPIFDEIRYLYAPLAERLGLIFLADDFRDQCLRLSDPEKHASIENKFRERFNMNYRSGKIFLGIYSRELSAMLQTRLGLDYQGTAIKFRLKSPYSVWNKVEVRSEYSYDEIADFFGIKIIVNSEKVLFQVRDILKKNNIFMPNPNGIKEQLAAQSKEGHFRGIKIKGQDGNGMQIEIQIMTHEMNNENNRGQAATWKYNLQKELGGTEQTFGMLEPSEVITPNFVENYYQLLNYWLEPA